MVAGRHNVSQVNRNLCRIKVVMAAVVVVCCAIVCIVIGTLATGQLARLPCPHRSLSEAWREEDRVDT